MAQRKYNAASIEVLTGLEPVRKRPGMYIGSNDVHGLHHLVWEIVDNAVDEILAGFGQKVICTIHEDNSIEIQDFGRGIPCDAMADGRPAAEVVMTTLHAGGKFSSSGGYRTSGGLHGVGASVVNALSSWLELTVRQDGKIYHQRYEDGAKRISTMEVIGKTNETGTTIHFKPDPEMFTTIVYSYTTICERLRETAYLLKGVTIEVHDLRKDKHDIFLFEKGLEAFIAHVSTGKNPMHDVMTFEGKSGDIEIECALQFSDSYSSAFLSYCNMVRTPDGGSHEEGFKRAITRTFNDYARKYGMLKEKDKNFEGSDVREGLTAVISIKVPEDILQFEGQTKSKLGTPQARDALDSFVSERLSYYLEENKSVAEKLISKTVRAVKAREAARKARDEIRNIKNAKQERILSGKLAPAQSKDKKRKELYLVEGDSAGGSAKQGRDRKYQAILPLRGKVINAEKSSLAEMLKNEEIATMINTIGADIGDQFKVENAQYDKVIIMTDADTDGAHIQVLLLTFFYRYMTDLISAGKVYIALPPLYKVSRKNGNKELVEYAWDDDELEAAKKKVGRGYNVQRYKGLGEMNADQLWETTMNPDTRTLIQVSIEDAASCERNVAILMGDKVAPRREWIETNVQFSLEDDYVI